MVFVYIVGNLMSVIGVYDKIMWVIYGLGGFCVDFEKCCVGVVIILVLVFLVMWIEYF